MTPNDIVAKGIDLPSRIEAKALELAIQNENRRCIVRTPLAKPGDTFNLSGVAYKVAGDGSFHRLTEPKPSRKAWKRQQVMERKPERERKRRVNNYG